MTGDPPGRSRHRTLAIAIGLAAAVGGVIAVVVLAGGRSGSHEVAAQPASAPMPGGPQAGSGTSSHGPTVEPLDLPDGRIYTCAELEGAHQQALRDDSLAFRAALVAKRLELVTLEARPIGPFTEYEKPALRRDTPAWTEATDKIEGKPRQILLGEITDQTFGAPGPPELVVDSAGDVWRVERSATLSPRRSVEVTACSWGCWGQPPPGAEPPPAHRRDRWLLPKGHHFRGTITVEYTTAGMVENIVDQHCPMPA